jgi:diguanylate cyclase (GGDEF)-like protein
LHQDAQQPFRPSPLGIPIISVLAAGFSASVFFTILWTEEKSISAQERLKLVKLTESFVAIFSGSRDDQSMLPAEFRRLAIEHFTGSGADELSDQTSTVFRMSARPEYAIARAEPNERLADIIAGFVNEPMSEPYHEQRLENGRVVARTLVASVAESEGCVSCHNALLQQDVYAVGDIMGAYVVERDMTANALTNAKFSAIWFLASFLLFRAIGYRERTQRLQMMHLSSRVKMEELKSEADAKERFLLSHDTLTGLPNRKVFNEHLGKTFNTHECTSMTAMIVDLDDFKIVNDSMGHAAGDALLVKVAQRLTGATQEVDAMVARLGGDEFAVFWASEIEDQKASAVAERILESVVKTVEFESWKFKPKCSIGVAVMKRRELTSPSDLLKSADAALYVAKGKGKNTYQIYDHAIDATVRRRNEIAAVLPDSIRDGDIRVVFQPQVCLHDGVFHGFEALARWRYDGQDIPPDEFIEIAEGAGVIEFLDLYVLEHAMRHSRWLEAQTGMPVPISVNLSVKSCQSPRLVEEIQDMLWSAGFPAEQLTLEVTETSLIEHLSVVQSTLRVLRALGVRTSLDDFGTGYSSLSHFTQMEFDEVKIDREFVRDIAEGNDNHTLMTHLSDMFSALDIDLVIEGIETQTQIELVRGKGHRVGQGYFFSKPLSQEETVQYLTRMAGQQDRFGA